MRFADPAHFYWLWLVPAAILLIVYTARRAGRLKERFGDPRLMARLSQEVNVGRVIRKDVLLILTLTFMVAALARPQFGEREVHVKREGIDVLVALDTSLSMQAEDFKPNRLEAAKRAVKTLIKQLKGDRIGIISFAGKSFVQPPLTLDYNAALIFLDQIDVDSISLPGTALGEMIVRATQAFSQEEKKYKALVIFSDGEDHGTKAVAQAKLAAEEGVRIYCVGIGRLDGAPIPLRDEEGRIIGNKKDKAGQVVITKLGEETLREVALVSGGAYYRATRKGTELDKLYEEIYQLEKKQLEDRFTESYVDRFQWFLGFACYLLLVEFFIPERRKVKAAWTARA